MEFPRFSFPLRTQQIDEVLHIYDPVRKKLIVLTPEEWVRQHVLFLLIEKRNIARGRIAVERQIKQQNKRFDVLIHNAKTGQPEVIIECKSYKETINQSTFDQVSRYNMHLKVPYLVITNWHQWMAAEIDQESSSYRFLDSFPDV